MIYTILYRFSLLIFLIISFLSGMVIADDHCRHYNYSFDDCSINGGQIVGTQRCVRGLIGEAFWFGGKDYIKIPQYLGRDFTIALWLKTQKHSLTGTQCYEGNGIVWSDVPNIHNDYILSILNDRACFFTGNPDMSIVSHTTLTDGKWHFIAVTRRMSDGHVVLYVDGQKEAEMYSSKMPLTDQNYIAIGANVVAGRYFAGMIDDLQLYTCALDDSKIKQLYNAVSRSPKKKIGIFGTKSKNPFIFEGKIYFINPGTSKLPDFSRLKSTGKIYSAILNIPPQDFQNGFPGITNRYEWFAIDYKGKIYIPNSRLYTFALLSDDGAKLIIDGRTVIDNDGIHPPKEKVGSINLKKGLHEIEVQYFQGPRYQVALVLSLVENGKKIPFDIRKFSPVNLKEEKCQSKLTLGNSILFDFDKYNLKPQAIKVLDSVVNLLKNYNYKWIIVSGHTDNIGSDSYNYRLSEQRARSVASYLIAKGIPAMYIKTVGYGKNKPIVPNDTEEHRAMNRRVEIVVKKNCPSSNP